MGNFVGLESIYQNSKLLKSFIEEGKLANYLFHVQFAAAKESLSKAKMANNPDAQVWNAIGQLEVANSILNSKIKSYSGLNTISAVAEQQYHDNTTKLIYCLSLMAICYTYVNEKELCLSHLNKALNIKEKYEAKKENNSLLIGLSKLAIQFPLYMVSALAGNIEKTRDMGEMEISIKEIKTFIKFIEMG